MKAIASPAGDHFGSLSLSPLVSRRAFAAGFPWRPVGNSHSSVLLSFFAMSKLVTAAQASAPSGDSVGAATRLIAHNASTVSGGLRFVAPAARRALARERAGIGGSLWVQWSAAILPSAPIPARASAPTYFHKD